MDKFIVTNSQDSKDILINAGFILISDMHNEWVFINDKSLMARFDNNNKLKIRFTNKLNI